MPSPEWMERSACLGSDPEIFFPPQHAWIQSITKANGTSIAQEVELQDEDVVNSTSTDMGLCYA